MKCIVFDLPESLMESLGLVGMEDFMSKYIVTENGNLMVPWYDFIDEENCDDELTCAIVGDVEYYDAQELVKSGKEEYREILKGMLSLMINFHRDRFDRMQEQAKA